MTPPSSESEPAQSEERTNLRPVLAMLRQHWRLVASGLALLIVLIAGLIALAYHQGFFVRGPAVDAATAFLTDVQRRNYTAAYALLAPDLKAHETEPAFATATDAIRQADGPVTSFAVREMNSDGSLTVVGFDATRSIRGGFTIHVSLAQDKSGRWLITGIDDL